MQIKINNRNYYFSRIQSVTRETGCSYGHIVETTHGTYRVFGGRKAGGSARDWFLAGVDGKANAIFTYSQAAINCTSMVDALNCLENA